MGLVEVEVPDGCFAGDLFTVTGAAGEQLDVTVPDGCGPGTLLSVELPDPPADSAADAGTVEVTIPDGCGVDSSFLVELPDGRQVEITVPDGCGPGQLLTVAVPPKEEEEEVPPPPPPPPARSTYGGGGSSSTGGGGSSSFGAGSSSGGVTGSSSAAGGCSWGGSYLSKPSMPAPAPAPASSAEWAPASSLFAMGPSEGFGREAGDFHVGQLVQVTRSDHSWTYGKIMAYDSLGDTYSVMTRAGAKHFVERDQITDDIVVNPSDGSCAQQ